MLYLGSWNSNEAWGIHHSQASGNWRESASLVAVPETGAVPGASVPAAVVDTLFVVGSSSWTYWDFHHYHQSVIAASTRAVADAVRDCSY